MWRYNNKHVCHQFILLIGTHTQGFIIGGEMGRLRLHTHLKRAMTKASIMEYTIEEVHKMIDDILRKYGVRNKGRIIS